MLNKKYFKLFSNCIPVKGYKRSAIYDLVRNKFVLIPNELHTILKQFKNLSLTEIKAKYNNNYNDIIDEYFEFLLSNDFVFFVNSEDELKKYPELSMDREDTCLISNAILEIDGNNDLDIHNTFLQLSSLNCKNLQIKFISESNLKEMELLLIKLEDSTIQYIEFIFPLYSGLNQEDIVNLFKKYPRLYSCYIYNSKRFEIVPFKDLGNIVFIKDDLSSKKSCGFIHPNNFTINIDFFLESINYNSCLNKKVAIDKDGNIKNCLELNDIYGNIQKDNLSGVITQQDFQKFWNINKDKISICKDCEFRYMCLDCRGNTENPNNVYSKPANCNYNPYKASGF